MNDPDNLRPLGSARSRGWVVAPLGIEAPGLAGLRLQQRLGALRRLGGGAFVGPGPAPLIPGVRHFPVSVPPGLDLERAEALVAEALGGLLLGQASPPAFVHAFGLGLGARALTHQRRGLRVYVEPGVTTAQRARAERPELSAERVEPLVTLEDKVLVSADGVVARNPIEAGTLVRRGTHPDRMCLVRDGLLPLERPGPPPVDLPHLALLATAEPWDGWALALAALARLHRPWRLTFFLRPPLSRSAVEASLATLRISARVVLTAAEPFEPERLEPVQAFICALTQSRPVVAGAVDLDGVALALTLGRPVIAPDLPAIRAVAGAALHAAESAEDTGALAKAIDSFLADEHLRAELTEAAEARRAVLHWRDADDLLADLWAGPGAEHRTTPGTDPQTDPGSSHGGADSVS